MRAGDAETGLDIATSIAQRSAARRFSCSRRSRYCQDRNADERSSGSAASARLQHLHRMSPVACRPASGPVANFAERELADAPAACRSGPHRHGRASGGSGSCQRGSPGRRRCRCQGPNPGCRPPPPSRWSSRPRRPRVARTATARPRRAGRGSSRSRHRSVRWRSGTSIGPPTRTGRCRSEPVEDRRGSRASWSARRRARWRGAGRRAGGRSRRWRVHSRRPGLNDRSTARARSTNSATASYRGELDRAAGGRAYPASAGAGPRRSARPTDGARPGW